MTDELAKVVEVRLVGWGDGVKGPWIRIQFDHQDQLEEFRPLKTGSANGQRMAISFALIDDQEGTEPLDPSAAENPQKTGDEDPDVSEYGTEPSAAPETTEAAPGQASAKTGGFRLGTAKAEECGRFCNDPGFQAFLLDAHAETIELELIGHGYDPVPTAIIVRHLCKIGSRRELDTDDGAWQRWCGLMSDYACWADANKRLQEAGEG